MHSFFKFYVLLFVIYSVNGDQFTVLKSPKSLEFKGKLPLSTETILDVFASSLGYSVASSPDTAKWEGFVVNDPFNTATGIINIIVEGLDKIEFTDAKSFKIEGHGDPISSILDEINKHDGISVDLDLKSGVSKTLETVFGIIVPKYTRKLHFVKSKEFLNQIAMVDGLSKILEENDNHLPTATVVRISLDSILKTHEAGSPAYNEMIKVLKDSIEQLVVSTDKAYKNEVLITMIVTAQPIHKRVRRAAVSSEDDKFNIAPAYDENYPIIFNIIFWFSVVMIFSLLAISLAIGNMDPGRDSIIYRMTSTRMKKDN